MRRWRLKVIGDVMWCINAVIKVKVSLVSLCDVINEAMEIKGSLVTLCDVINAAIEVKGSLVTLCGE